MLERILVGTDGSEVATSAVAVALRVAQATGAEMRAAHAMHLPTLYSPAPAFDPRILEQRERAGEKVLAAVRERAEDAGVPVSTVQREAAPGQLILDEAEDWEADLVAVGTQAATGLPRAILGSVADQLVREAPAPVLTVSQTETPPVEASIDRIVVPSDGSERSLAAAPLAVELARAADADLDLLYVVPPELEGGEYLDRPVTEVEDVHDRLADEALDPLQDRCQREGLSTCERFVRHDQPHVGIVEHAREREADLVVMATRGRGGLERFLVGSTADKVLRTADTPVVTVRPPGSDGT